MGTFCQYVTRLVIFVQGQVAWKDASSFSTVCFLLSDSLPALDLKSSWFVQAKPEWKKFYEQIYMAGCDRLSQGGKHVTREDCLCACMFAFVCVHVCVGERDCLGQYFLSYLYL